MRDYISNIALGYRQLRHSRISASYFNGKIISITLSSAKCHFISDRPVCFFESDNVHHVSPCELFVFAYEREKNNLCALILLTHSEILITKINNLSTNPNVIRRFSTALFFPFA